MNLIFYAFLLNIFGVAFLSGSGLAPLASMAGIWMIQTGMTKVDPENPRFKKIFNLYYIAMGLHLIVFLMGFFNIAVLTTLVGFVITLVEIYLTYHLIRGIQQYADRFQDEKLTARLFNRWRVTTVFTVLILVSVIVLVGLSLTSVSWQTITEVTQAISVATPDQSSALIISYTELYPSLMANMSLLALGLILFGLPAFVFEVMFLFAFYKVQKQFKPLDTDTTSRLE